MTLLIKKDNKKQVNRDSIIEFHNKYYDTRFDSSPEERDQEILLLLNQFFTECNIPNISYDGKWSYDKLRFEYDRENLYGYVYESKVLEYSLKDTESILIGGTFRINDGIHHTLKSFLELLLKDIRKVWSDNK